MNTLPFSPASTTLPRTRTPTPVTGVLPCWIIGPRTDGTFPSAMKSTKKPLGCSGGTRYPVADVGRTSPTDWGIQCLSTGRVWRAGAIPSKPFRAVRLRSRRWQRTALRVRNSHLNSVDGSMRVFCSTGAFACVTWATNGTSTTWVWGTIFNFKRCLMYSATKRCVTAGMYQSC